MGFYASGFGSLNLQADASREQVEAAIEHLDRETWMVDDLADHLSLSFSGKYRNAEVAVELTHLVGLAAAGEYVQFTGEDGSVWRVLLTADGLARQDVHWTEPHPIAITGG